MKIVSIEDIAEKVDYGLTEKAKDEKIGPKFLRITDIQDSKVNWDTVPYCKCDEKEFAKNKLEVGDIVFARTGATTGKSFLVKRLDHKVVYASYLIRLRLITDQVLPEFVSYFFKSDKYWNQIYADSDGATLPSFNATKLKALKIPLPSLSEQKAILAKLDRAQRLIDIDKEMLAKYDELIQSVFLEMFGDPVTNPKGWDRVSFEKIAEIDKESFDPTDFTGNVEYVGLSSIVKGSGKIIDVETITEGDVKSNKYRFSPYHILYGKLRPYLNKVAFPDFSGVCSTDILPIKARDEVSTKSFIGYLLKTKEFIHYADKNSSGANLPRISPKMVKKFNAFHPPLELQVKFDNFVTRINSEKKKTLQASIKSEELFSSLVQGAFG